MKSFSCSIPTDKRKNCKHKQICSIWRSQLFLMERGGDHLHGGFNLNRFHKPSETAAGNGKAATLPPPCTVREQDQYMPIANVIRIMRRILPSHAKISDDAKETIQECVSEYISFITGEANERCQREQRKTITAEDILWAMGKLGFDNYVEPLNFFLARFRDSENDRGSFRSEPIIKRNMEYGPMTMDPYGVPYNMGQIPFPGIYEAPPAINGYFRDGSGAGGSSAAQNPMINFEPFAQFK